MTNNMAKGSHHPSVYDKIYGKSYLVTRLSCIDKLHNRYSLNGGYVVNSGLRSPELNLKWRSTFPSSVEGQSEKKGNANRGSKTIHDMIPIVVSEIAAAPFKRVKLLIQNQNDLLKRGRLIESYKGINDCFARTIKVEGYLPLWRGNSANIIANVTHEVFYGTLKYYFHRRFNNIKIKAESQKSYRLLVAWKVAANSAAILSLLPFVYSLDYAHTRLANDIVKASLQSGFSLDNANKKGGISDQYHQRQFNGLIDVYKKTLKSDGIAGLYRGFSVCCLGTVVHTGLHVGTYASLGALFFILGLGSADNLYTTLIVHSGSSGFAGLACHPFDTVRRRMIMTSGEAFKYKSSWDAFSQIVENEGAKSLFKGVGASFLQSFVRSFVAIGCLAFINRKE